ncbi:MAG: SBBP repeat-containing protein [Verrucomicrobiota bacterium]
MKENSTNPVAGVQNHLQTAFLALVAFSVVTPICSAQIQQAWVARYNNGITNGTNQAVKIALDTNGNIYVTGFSQSTNGNLGYATIKYAPNGNQVWASRFDSTNTVSAKPAGMVLDSSGDIIVTGNAVTVKYDLNGNQLWTAPYSGRALAIQSNANVVVAGCGNSFNTVNLSPQGSNLWTTTYTDVGPTVAQVVAVDLGGNVYVSGYDIFFVQRSDQEWEITTIKYGADGVQLWINSDMQWSYALDETLSVAAAGIDGSGNFIVVYNPMPETMLGFLTIKYATNNGAELWKSSYNGAVNWLVGTTYGLALDSSNNVLLTGQEYVGIDIGHSTYATCKLNATGLCVWTNNYPRPGTVLAVATAITTDSANNVYVTGYSPGTNSGNDIVTIKYDNNGNQIWLQRYNGPGNGDDEGNAIAVDANGNVYVTGYETTSAGGTEMVVIKYAPGPFLKKEANGSFMLQAVGAAGEGFDFQASTDLVNWQDLGTNTADSNGLVQFLDTNAPLFPYRFYLATPQQ